MDEVENKRPVLYILVVGFHHKLGCQVEFSYPPLLDGTKGKEGGECPSGWKYLSTLALPDGSHNFTEDTVFFNLPSLTEPSESVYGVSCYRQISVNQLKIRTADVTRSTVQKSVCCLTRLPIYAYIEVKLSLIADAFFDQGDFSNTELLVRAYQELNASLQNDDTFLSLHRTHQLHRHNLPHQHTMLNDGHHLYTGLWLREIVLHWRHKLLQLLKLFLLQRRTIFYGSPVRRMGVLILGISSLIPRLLERGFQEVACVRTSRPLSPMPDYTDALKAAKQEEQYQQQQISKREKDDSSSFCEFPLSFTKNNNVKGSSIETGEIPSRNDQNVDLQYSVDRDLDDKSSIGDGDGSKGSTTLLNRADSCDETTITVNTTTNRTTNSSSSNSINTKENNLDSNSTNILIALSSVNPDEYRAPLSIFASGNLCLPYLSLPYMDLLMDPSVLSYVVGTSNVLFQQKRHLSDVLIDIEGVSLDINDADLKRQLILTTEDLRFMDYVLKHVQSPKEDGEGSEVWIRTQFQGYLLALMRATITSNGTGNNNNTNMDGNGLTTTGNLDQPWLMILPSGNNTSLHHHHGGNNNKTLDHFNSCFVHAFMRTQCFQEWYDVRPDNEFFLQLPVGHPFATGTTLSVADMKLKITQTMQSSESGRKLNQAVSTTSRAVGGAISHAKDAFSNWWSAITASTAISTSSLVSPTSVGTDCITKNEGYQQATNNNSSNFEQDKDNCLCQAINANTSKSVFDTEKSTSNINSAAYLTTLVNRRIELAKEVEDEVGVEEMTSCREESTATILNIKKNLKQETDKSDNLTTATTPAKALTPVAGKLTKLSKYECSDVYIV